MTTTRKTYRSPQDDKSKDPDYKPPGDDDNDDDEDDDDDDDEEPKELVE